MLRVTEETLLAELTTARQIIIALEERVRAGIPGVTVPSSDNTAFDRFIYQVAGELLVCAAKCESLATVLEGTQA